MHYLEPHATMHFLCFIVFALIQFTVSSKFEYLNQGSSLSVEKSDHEIIVSPDHTFSAGFHGVGDNAYCFAIWFAKSANFTPVWMANRDQPVNGKGSFLSLRKGGNLVIVDAGKSTLWETGTTSTLPVHLKLSNMGNLMLQTSTNATLWQSFEFPTNTLLPQQQFTRDVKLVSSRSQSNFSSGFYSFFFDNDNVLRLLYKGPNISSIYWPDPGLVTWDAGRTTYNSSRIAVFDLWGYFQSTDDLEFAAIDFGLGLKRRLALDHDGNLRLYSLDEKTGAWEIAWQAISNACTMHGLCGPNSICAYEPERRCLCPHGFLQQDATDASQGCYPVFNYSCDPRNSTFIAIPYTDFYGYDFNYTEGATYQECMDICLELCSCKAFMYFLDGVGKCYPKTTLVNGYRSSSKGTMYIKVPRNAAVAGESDVKLTPTSLTCSSKKHVGLQRIYERRKESGSWKYLSWFVTAFGGAELICLVMGLWYIYKNRDQSVVDKGYALVSSRFKRFSYAELKKATGKFSDEIGRGGGGGVYKGVLSDGRRVAVKRLEGMNQGEAEFLAEVSIIGRINHMNLIQVWGYCAEGKHRLLVYEYMANGSLAQNLSSHTLNWDKRFEIAVGMAKGLAYLHEDCLEWVLHCDVKPQNILLDEDYSPKVADFGLSKLKDRNDVTESNFSRIRGTRGYMAPEWITNQPVTSKIDVYSYGIVVLEMVTGKSPSGFSFATGGELSECRNLVAWVREVKVETGLLDVMDPMIRSGFDPVKMEVLIKVALQCVDEDMDSRPSMSQVVEMLLCQEKDRVGT